jgi:hypothetical protein
VGGSGCKVASIRAQQSDDARAVAAIDPRSQPRVLGGVRNKTSLCASSIHLNISHQYDPHIIFPVERADTPRVYQCTRSMAARHVSGQIVTTIPIHVERLSASRQSSYSSFGISHEVSSESGVSVSRLVSWHFCGLERQPFVPWYVRFGCLQDQITGPS